MRIIRLLHRALVRQSMPAAAVPYYARLADAAADLYLTPVCQAIEEAFPAGARILDVGTGTGHLPVLLAGRNPRYDVTGVDLAASCIRAARARGERAGLSDRVRFVHGDVTAAEGPFDLAVSTCSLHHWRNPRRELARMGASLRPGGEAWVLDDSADVTEDERREWVRRVRRAFADGWLFRAVFLFESRHLAYGDAEVRGLARSAGLQVIRMDRRDVFFLARMRPAPLV